MLAKIMAHRLSLRRFFGGGDGTRLTDSIAPRSTSDSENSSEREPLLETDRTEASWIAWLGGLIGGRSTRSSRSRRSNITNGLESRLKGALIGNQRFTRLTCRNCQACEDVTGDCENVEEFVCAR